MKYIITEDKMNETLRNFIINKFPEVYDVYFTTGRKALGSTEGTPIIDYTNINIIINNSGNKYNLEDLYLMSDEIVNKVNGVFGLNIAVYGSSWEIVIKQIAVVELRTPLSNLK